MGRVYKFIILFFIIVFCLFILSGCRYFQINMDTTGKKILYGPVSFYDGFYIANKGEKKEVKISYILNIGEIQDAIEKGFIIDYINRKFRRNCSIWPIQNRGNTLTAYRVNCLKSKKYYINNNWMIMPEQYVLLVSGKKIIYYMEAPEPTIIQWINNDRLQILFSHRKIIVNNKGREVFNKKYSKDLLKMYYRKQNTKKNLLYGNITISNLPLNGKLTINGRQYKYDKNGQLETKIEYGKYTAVISKKGHFDQTIHFIVDKTNQSFRATYIEQPRSATLTFINCRLHNWVLTAIDDSEKSWCVFNSNILALPSGHYRIKVFSNGKSFYKEATIQEGEDWVYDFTADKISKE